MYFWVNALETLFHVNRESVETLWESDDFSFLILAFSTLFLMWLKMHMKQADGNQAIELLSSVT